MALDDISDRISQPHVCRCCLSANGIWDLTTVYLSDTGIKEVFAEILRSCLGINLSHINEMDSSKLVCEICVNQLRSTSKFHKQVVHADRCFSQYHESRKDDTKSNSNKKMNKTLLKEIHSKETVTKNIKSDSEYDSDTPIAKIKHALCENGFVNSDSEFYDNCELKDNILKQYEDRVDNLNTERDAGKMIKNIKQVSERKRVILTCGTVLRETTACPFRHHKSWFQCFFCSQDFMEIDSLRSHNLQFHTDIETELKKIKRYPRSLQIDISNLECRNCQLNLTDVETMKRHFVEKHNKLIYKECIADYKVNASPYTCHICKREFHVFRTLTTHLNEHYANCICDVCGKSFLNTKRLKVHKRTHENGSYPCNECGKVLKTKTSKANHMESAHSKRVIKCQICFEPMKHYNDRVKHMSEVHNITHKFKCPMCSREYNIKHYLATHIRQTHGHKNKKCVECGMAFITNHGLKKHMSKHTGERPFSCSICCKSYARSYTLREHMRAHENDKRLVGAA
ncbi:zinc finger protein ZFP2-like [Vanessa atalanta]|uniref:zinc finger protein ZFP2-like n=1 Tax=Vanessa atalanta TaxID=42275 RepID=UPI001FCCE4E5|nr:zinc finger protein ZFP2-like [Vanessa atalanta]